MQKGEDLEKIRSGKALVLKYSIYMATNTTNKLMKRLQLLLRAVSRVEVEWVWMAIIVIKDLFLL